MDLEVVGRHVLLFDDDAQAAFVNSPSALVPWAGDASLVIDRYDVRHLLPSIPAKRGVAYVELELDGLTRLDLDKDRYLDLPNPEEGGAEGASKGEEADSGMYQAVPFSYADCNGYISNGGPDACSGYHPPFPLPENLLSCMPSTEKLHQIIARTALFVARHGGQSEIILRVKQGDNPTFGFLMPTHELHPYFRFLVEHPDLLNTDSSINARAENPSGMGNKQSKSAGGALSLLGSAYGSLDEDERTVQESLDAKETELGNPCSSSLASELTQQSNQSAIKDPIPDSEVKSPPSSKENTQTLKKNPPVVPSNSISASCKPKVQANPVDTIASKTHPTTTEVEKMIVEPPSTMKETISKITEFILRNGREFEAVLIEQDRPHGRFPFLLPTNLYHAYYLKFLHEAQENKRLGKRSNDRKHDSQESNDCGRKSREGSVSAPRRSGNHSDGLYDPEQKGKFKMVLGGPKKDVRESSPKPCKEPGVSVDMAAAIVMAATRGFDGSPGVQLPAKPSPISTDTAAAIVMAATRASNSSTRDSVNFSPPGRGHRTTSFESLSSTLRNSSVSVSGLLSMPEVGTSVSGYNNTSRSTERKGIGGTDGVKVANVIAKNVAIAAASEADSSEASLTKEQKLKAERLKRAKLFTSMIKSGAPDLTKLLPAAAGQGGAQGIGHSSVVSDSKSDHSRKEREGSSMPVDVVGVSGKLNERDCFRPSTNDSGDVELEEHGHLRRKKTSRSGEERRHKRRYRSSSRSSRQESSSEDELPHRKRSSSGHHHHRRDRRHSDYDDGDKNRSRSDDSHRRRKSHSETKKILKAKDLMETIEEQPDPISANSEDVAPSSISNDLRAKVRAMLLATL